MKSTDVLGEKHLRSVIKIIQIKRDNVPNCRAQTLTRQICYIVQILNFIHLHSYRHHVV